LEKLYDGCNRYLTVSYGYIYQVEKQGFYNPYLPAEAGTLPLSRGRDGDGVEKSNLVPGKFLIYNRDY